MLHTLTDKQLLWRGRRIASKRKRLQSAEAAALEALRDIWLEGKRRGLKSHELVEGTEYTAESVRDWWRKA